MSDAPSYSEAADGLHSEKSAPVEPAEESKRLQSSVAQFTSKSIKELEGLTFELHGLEEFLKSETERVQGDINNALALSVEKRAAGSRPGKALVDARTADATLYLGQWSKIIWGASGQTMLPSLRRAASLRRLRKNRPDLHVRVMAGELTPH
jgi:hypothetical protein